MLRTQIQFEPETLKDLRREAARRSCSISEIVRESVNRTLGESKKRSLREASLELGGQFKSGLGDLSQKHDEYLSDGF